MKHCVIINNISNNIVKIRLQKVYSDAREYIINEPIIKFYNTNIIKTIVSEVIV